MLSHLGLRSRMAASYVLVSAAAVLLVEAALLAVMVPRVRSADQAAQQAQERLAQAEQGLVQLKVKSLATNLASIVAKAASAGEDDHPGRSDQALITDAAQVGLTDATGRGTGGSGTEEKDSIVRVVADPGGRIIDVSPAQVYAPSSDLPQPARAGAPKDGQRATPGGAVYWATAPIQFGRNEKNQRTIGVAYVEISPGNSGSGGQGAADEPTVAPGDAPQATEAVTDPKLQPASASSGGTTIASLVVPGIVALVLLIPVGAIFGLLSTGRLIRRIRRLSDGTSEMAEGDLRVRVPVSSGDEVGRLEQAFNSMAERLAAAVAEQRAAAGAEARRAERSRIARELHDSISQELFSVSVVAVGMRKALEPGSVLQEQAASMERSLARTMREMRALLMELRPVQLEDAGLAAALEELCRAYEARLGIRSPRTSTRCRATRA